jgi:SprT protein
MSKMQQVHEATLLCLKRAEALYGVDLSDVVIRFDLKGVVAGMAGYRRQFGLNHYYLRFNTTMIAGEGFDHIINDTVPHEIAHMVCFKNPRLGSNHNSGWRNICLKLGGNGQTYHDEAVVYAKGKTYEYTCTNGTPQRFSEQRHRRIQRGGVLNLKRGGTINNTCAYTVVGISGRPLTARALTTDATPLPIAAKKAPVTRATEPKAFVGSKAGRVRNMIAKCLEKGHTPAETQDLTVAFAVNILGMKASMAKRYVAENYSKVAA